MIKKESATSLVPLHSSNAPRPSAKSQLCLSWCLYHDCVKKLLKEWEDTSLVPPGFDGFKAFTPVSLVNTERMHCWATSKHQCLKDDQGSEAPIQIGSRNGMGLLSSMKDTCCFIREVFKNCDNIHIKLIILICTS